MKPTAASFDKEAASWSLSWQPDGRCNNFTREAILACAPPTSGVYGLFNFDCQILIGASANIRESLLRHESETDFQSAHLRPTGFTFEPCTAELCKPKVDDLIAKFRPLLQSEAALTDTWSPANAPMASEVGQSGNEIKIHTDHHEFPVHESERQPKARRRFRFKRTQGSALAAIVVASAMVIFYLGMPADYAIQKRANGANPTSGQPEIGLRPQNVSSIDTPSELANQSATTAMPDVRAPASTRNAAVRLATKSTPSADRDGVQAKTRSDRPLRGKRELDQKVVGADFRGARKRHCRYFGAEVKGQGLRWLHGPDRGERTNLLSRAGRTFRRTRKGGSSAPVVGEPRGLS